MPKLKTHRGAAKRFRATGGGRLRRNQAFHRHIFTKKSPKRKRQLRKAGLVDHTNIRSLHRLLPYL